MKKSLLFFMSVLLTSGAFADSILKEMQKTQYYKLKSGGENCERFFGVKEVDGFIKLNWNDYDKSLFNAGPQKSLDWYGYGFITEYQADAKKIVIKDTMKDSHKKAQFVATETYQKSGKNIRYSFKMKDNVDSEGNESWSCLYSPSTQAECEKHGFDSCI